MPRGGRRPGAGAPKGNFNAVRSGTSSRRLRIAMTTLLAVPEYRHVLRFLLAGGQQAHRDVTDLLIASARLLYDRPLKGEVQQLVEQAAARYVASVGHVEARKAVRAYHRRLRVSTGGNISMDRNRNRTRADPGFTEFLRLIAGVTPDTNAASAASRRSPSPPAERGLGGEVHAQFTDDNRPRRPSGPAPATAAASTQPASDEKRAQQPDNQTPQTPVREVRARLTHDSPLSASGEGQGVR